jgi:hypothetical protein
MRNHRTSASRRRAIVAVSLAMLVMVLVSCRTTTQDVMMYGGQLSRPQRLVVYDFTSTTGNVQLGSGLGGRLKEELGAAGGTAIPEQQLKLQQQITRTMTAQLVQEIRKLGLPAEAAAMAGPAIDGQLSVEGQFLTIDEGNRTRRLVIGLGAGASHVRVAVQVFQTLAGQNRLVEDFYTNASSSKKPGFGPMAGAGAAAGAATAATAGVGIGTTALMGPQDAESDTKEAAVAITKELARFFAKQGWITPEQAESYHPLTP